MPPERPDFVFLDLGQVIVTFDRERAFRQMADVSGADPAAIRRVVIDEGLQTLLERGGIGWEGFCAEFSRKTGTAPDPLALAHAASDMFELNVGLLPVIAGLERAGCGLGILSNTCGIHWEHLLARRFAVLPGNFRELVLSHEVGSVKPDPEIYAAAASRCGAAPARIFFADDIQAHVDAARAAGWQAELFTGPTSLIDALDRRGLKLGL